MSGTGQTFPRRDKIHTKHGRFCSREQGALRGTSRHIRHSTTVLTHQLVIINSTRLQSLKEGYVYSAFSFNLDFQLSLYLVQS